jgi:hypothetical protein
MVMAVCLPLPLVSGDLSIVRLAFEEMIKRRRTGVDLASDLGALWLLWLRDVLRETDDFLFNIKYQT